MSQIGRSSQANFPPFLTKKINPRNRTKGDAGLGTVVGSAVFNMCVIVGVVAVVAKEPLKLAWFPLVRDSFFYFISLVLLTSKSMD